MTETPVYISGASAANALGSSWESVADALFAGDRSGLEGKAQLSDGRTPPVGRLRSEPAPLPAPLAEWESRNNRLVHLCLQPLLPAIEAAAGRYGLARLGVVIGTSTSGIGSWETALPRRLADGVWPNDFRFPRHELGDPSAFVAAATGIAGPAWSVSTACTSGAKAMVSAARLIKSGL